MNATKADSFKRRDRFILTQVPLLHTVIDFWRLIKDHSVSRIILLSQLDAEKSYWPKNVNESIEFESFSIKLLKESSDKYDGIAERKFRLDSKIDPTEDIIIKQYHLLSWAQNNEDFTKIEILSLLKNLISRVDGPVVIQCMNGVDRSSMFITFHNVSEMIETSQPIDIISTIKRLRSTTSHSIRSQLQFLTVYNWILKLLGDSDYYNA